MQVHIALFGAFRDLQGSAELTLALDAPASVADLKAAFAAFASARWPDRFQPALLQVAAVADAEQVLSSSAAVQADAHYALLPPVSGG